MDSEETVTRRLAEALEIDPRSIRRGTTSKDVEAWDSVGTMNILLWLNTEFGINLNPNETEKLQSVESILGLLRAAGKIS